MPLRAFVDSDVTPRHLADPHRSVLMPLRAFVDSDGVQLNANAELEKGLNALAGIC